jgi:predicted DNA-binding protein YlxM (UPF0122 family)
MNEVYEISLLLDFYGQLLTDRQYEILDLHYNNDYTLSEIAQQLNISRQGVYDNEKRGRAVLNEYEEKLGLVNKFSDQRQKIKGILVQLSHVNIDELSENNKKVIIQVQQQIDELVKSI